MRRTFAAVSILFFALVAHAWSAEAYFPPYGDDNWERRPAAAVGMSARKLAAAVEFAETHESTQPRDQALTNALAFSREPYNEILGPATVRGPATGLILRYGYIVAEWGEPARVDMTHSVTKSFLSTVVGVAHDRGLIRDLHEPVFNYLPEYFDSTHNRKITWDHLLRQTSAWQGTLWDKPDWADRPAGDDPFQWPHTPHPESGTVYEYNDVRVNLLALAALHVWRKPLPAVLREHVMDPIGASVTWRWHGYRNSWVVLDGREMQSVSGGGHWGGGMFISAYDQARFGYLTLRRGQWNDRRVFSEDWYRLATTPTQAEPTYGFMNWFLNTERKFLRAAPENAIIHLGAGTNMIYVDPAHDLLVVARWIPREHMNELIKLVLAAVESD